MALMCLAAFLQGIVFYGPVASLYRTQAGLSMGDIALIESVYYLLVVALELPLGAVAARLGYKRMLAVCSAVFFSQSWFSGGRTASAHFWPSA